MDETRSTPEQEARWREIVKRPSAEAIAAGRGECDRQTKRVPTARRQGFEPLLNTVADLRSQLADASYLLAERERDSIAYGSVCPKCKQPESHQRRMPRIVEESGEYLVRCLCPVCEPGRDAEPPHS